MRQIKWEHIPVDLGDAATLSGLSEDVLYMLAFPKLPSETQALVDDFDSLVDAQPVVLAGRQFVMVNIGR